MGIAFIKLIVRGWAYIEKIRQKTYLIYYKSEFNHIGKNSIIEYPAFITGFKNISIGDNFIARRDSKIRAYEYYGNLKFISRLQIGNNVYLGTNCCLSAVGEMSIGNNVTLASNVSLINHMHGLPDYSDIRIPVLNRTLTTKGPIIIEDNVWIGEGVKVLGGVTIGENSIIGANSVVTHSIPSYCVAAGVPARVIKTLL